MTDAELASFARIAAKRAALQAQLEQKAKGGVSEAQLKELQGQFQEKLVQIVRESPLGEKRYKEISTLVARDAALQRRVLAAIEQDQEDPRR